ncbi:MAG: efflux RND transporter periplasmic adaptor subunit [Legionellales bacterium]
MDLNKKYKLLKMAGMVLAVLVVFKVLMHYFAKPDAQGLPVPAVTVQKPQKIRMVDYITQTGTTVAYNSVNLVARVEGYLEEVLFVDGTFVKKNAPLFVIEPKPYMEQLLGAQATVAAQKAVHAYDTAEYLRQQRMFKENATSLNNVEKWLAKSHESEAEVAKAVASAEVAAITYSYTHIAAPFTGRIGRHLVDPHNLVGNGVATNLATLDQIDPIYVYFNLNELDLIKLRTAARAQGYKANKLKQVPVYVSMQNETGFKHEGKLNFINTGLNASTGTMEFRALLPNKDDSLVPGLFVQTRVATSKPILQLTVPDTAVLYDQIGSYLLTVDNNHTVLLKRVVLGGIEQGMRAILQGVDAQDDVIINGLQNATPGNKVLPSAQFNEKNAA